MSFIDEFINELQQVEQASAAPVLELPTLKLSLLPYQETTAKFSLSREESYLALDMGLGKTACAIAVATAEVQAGNTPVLICVPASLRFNWVREFSKFSPSVKVATAKGRTPYAIPDADVIIIGDSTLYQWAHPDQSKRTIHDLHGKVKAIIVDEAHLYKSTDSNRSKALVSLARSTVGRRILMSGTPIPNGRTMEMARQLDILGKPAWDAIGGAGYFWSHYAPKQQYGRGSHDLEGMGEAMRNSFMLRYRREDVLELPNKGRTAVALEGSGKAVNEYREIERDLIAYLKNSGKSWQGAQRAEALVRLNLLRRVAGEAKVPSIVEHVTNLMDVPGGVFIVAEHTSVIENLALRLHKFGVVMIRGGMTDDEKAEAVDDFNSGAARVMVGQIRAAGVGLTLHGDGLNHRVVIAQIPWTPAELRQAEDRLHRIGQTNDVNIDVTLCHIDGNYTIDERLWSVLEEKAFNTGVVIDGVGEYLLDDVQNSILDSYR